MDPSSPLPTSLDEELQGFAQEKNEVEAFFAQPRFKHTARPYSADDVVSLQGTIGQKYLSSYTANKLYDLVRSRFDQHSYTHTFGALDPVQVTTMAKYLDTVYVSGWQCSSTASTTNEPGPDFADYPMDTVPNKVDQLFKAQLFHDRKQREARRRMTAAERRESPAVDYLRPIIADADAGHGGITAAMKLTKLMVEAGAAALHIEDQKAGVKKCGHMGGKVLVSTREHVDRLVACRLQCDIMRSTNLVIARTDADSATLLDTDIDPRDHPFILGVTNKDIEPMEDFLAKHAGSGGDASYLKTQWVKEAGLKRFSEAVEDAINAKRFSSASKVLKLEAWRSKCMVLPKDQARALAFDLLGFDVYWNSDMARSREGFFRIKGGLDMAIARGRAFAPHCDLLWMETGKPNVEQCRNFAAGIHALYPHQMLAYNLSPSFNWDASGMSDAEIACFNDQIGSFGFAWQFITLAGFHSNGLIIDQFAKAYAKDKAMAYVDMIQRQERKLGVEVLMHQKWSGAPLADKMVNVATGGASTDSMGEGVTEKQFAGDSNKHAVVAQIVSRL